MPAKRADTKKAKKVAPKELSEEDQKKVTGGAMVAKPLARRAR